jgi:lipopolysaccharide/colanic/teichoic acid biosynthesis glycosyltransferase
MSKTFYRKSKRILDITISFLAIIITSPVLLLSAFLIWLTDGKEVIVKEPLRIGLYGKEFKMFKFRTMIPDAHNKIQNDPDYQDLKDKWIERDGKLKISEDRRITWIGKILRKTDMDELPQFFNVLVGDMSLVGPRPMYHSEIVRYLGKFPDGKKYLKRIQRVRPGLTGVWQVSGRNEIRFKDRVILEAKYASNVNIKDDIKIFFKTPFVVLTRKGVYE